MEVNLFQRLTMAKPITHLHTYQGRIQSPLFFLLWNVVQVLLGSMTTTPPFCIEPHPPLLQNVGCAPTFVKY